VCARRDVRDRVGQRIQLRFDSRHFLIQAVILSPVTPHRFDLRLPGGGIFRLPDLFRDGVAAPPSFLTSTSRARRFHPVAGWHQRRGVQFAGPSSPADNVRLFADDIDV